MASYPPPLEFNSIFNEAAYLADTTGITFGQADLRYLKLSGGILSGLLTTAAGISNAGQLIFSAAGNVNNPAIQFVDAKLGLYRHGSNHLRLGVNGTAVQGWQETYIENLQQIRNIDGTQATPSVSFANYTDSGMYIDAKNTIGFSTVGTKRLSVSDVDISAILPIKCDEFRTRLGVGTAGNTVYGSINTQGMYFGLNRINFSTNSVERLNIQDASMTVSVRTIFPDGNSAQPSITFASSNTSGFALTNTSGRMAVSANGTTVFQFANGGVNQSLLPTQVPAGSAVTPSLFGSGFNNTGFYWTAGPIINATVNGTQRAAFGSDGIKLYGSTAGNNSLYVPTGLQYYEEATVSMQFQFPSGGQTTAAENVKFVRVGAQIIMQIPAYAVITNNSGGARAYTSTTTIPLRFQPPTLVMSTLIGVVNGGNSNTLSCYINGGTIYIEKLTAQFANNDTFQTYSFSMSWVL